MQSADLDALAAQHPECVFAAFADISTGVTLRTAAGIDIPREVLDELCAEAALTFGTEAPTLGALPSHVAIKTVADAVFVFLRDPDEPGDALICMCRDSIVLPVFLAAAQHAFAGAA